MRLYLHIGTEKTGTTSLQQFMAANRRMFAGQRLLYPETPGADNHIALATIARRTRTELWEELHIQDREGWETYCRLFRDRFSAELSASGADTVVMSGEHCSSRLRTDEEVHRLLEVLDPLFTQITVVVYVRRQDDFLTSTYSTDIKNGGTEPLVLPDNETLSYRYDYWELLSRWARVFGRQNIVVRRYGREFLVNGNLIDDFMQVIGAEPVPTAYRPAPLNESLDAECLEFLRLLNAHIRPSEQRRSIVAALQSISNGPLIDLRPATGSELMGRLADSNRRVALEYFGGELAPEGDPLFGGRDGARGRVPPPTLTADMAVRIAARLYLQMRAGQSPGLGKPGRPSQKRSGPL